MTGEAEHYTQEKQINNNANKLIRSRRIRLNRYDRNTINKRKIKEQKMMSNKNPLTTLKKKNDIHNNMNVNSTKEEIQMEQGPKLGEKRRKEKL